MDCRAKFSVTKVAEFGYDGKRSDISRVKVHVPANTKHPVDGSETRYDRTEYESTGVPVREITLSAVYGSTPEDKSFATSTPSGSITFTLNNADLAEEFKPGMVYYVDFTKVGA